MGNGSRIIQGAKEALAFAAGEADEEIYRVHVPESVDVRGIRKKLQMTQADFARVFGFKLATLRRWEQKSRVPEGPARAYLMVIDREPNTVRRILAAE